MRTEPLSVELMRALLSYDKTSGIIRWKVDRRSGRNQSRLNARAGDVAGCTDRQGYVIVKLFSKRIPAHRIAFALHFGIWPSDEIVHLNGDRSDNRISNLAEASSFRKKGLNRKGKSKREETLCSVPGCGKLEVAKGLCPMHYGRNRLYGDPLVTKSTPNGEVQRYYRDVVLSHDSADCLLWPYNHHQGYGRIYKDGKYPKVHRLVCEEFHGPQPASKPLVAHSCDDSRCVNWRHLRWATQAENMEDKVLRGRSLRGESNNMAKLTEQQAREILSLKGKESQASIAKRYGVSSRTVQKLQSGATWSWLRGEGA